MTDDDEVKNSALITPIRIDEMVDSVIPVTRYAAKDLAANDVSSGDSFTIELVFTDEHTPKGKVSVQGYFPGHKSQRKEWNKNTVINVVRGGAIPPKGDMPELHRPKAPYEPSPPAFTGSICRDLAEATTWSKVQDVLNGIELIFFDYETTGFPDKETGDVTTNKPVQLGAVRVRNGEVLVSFNVFMKPGENLGTWSRTNLKDKDGNPLTDEWLGKQVSLEDAHKEFVTWLGDNAILVGHNAPFDRGVLEKALAAANIDYTPGGYVDTLRLARDLKVEKKTEEKPDGTASYRLGDLAKYYDISLDEGHRADADARAASELLGALLKDAARRSDARVSALLNLNEQNTKYQEELAKFQALKVEYAVDLAQYERDKANAAAWRT
jgi:DNA polymerase III epsilon subunit-like protein